MKTLLWLLSPLDFKVDGIALLQNVVIAAPYIIAVLLGIIAGYAVGKWLGL